MAMYRSRTAVAPLERLKILMQVQGSTKVYTGVWQVCTRPADATTSAQLIISALYCMSLSVPRLQATAATYKGLQTPCHEPAHDDLLRLGDKFSSLAWCAQGLVYMGKTEGIRGLFRGNWTNCIRIIPNSAVKFLTYEQLSRCVLQSALAGIIPTIDDVIISSWVVCT